MSGRTFDRLEWQRNHRRKTSNESTKKYERTKKGKVMRTYRNMQSRCSGILKGKAHIYEGLEVLPRESFYEWSLSDPTFNNLYEQWVSSDYCKKLSPSVDRKDTSVGYILGNMQWITHSENSRKGAKSRSENG